MMLAVSLALVPLVMVPSATAGPPEGPSGRMELDEVADGLRRYRKETDAAKRARWLEKLAPTKDPRVGVALGEALGAEGTGLWYGTSLQCTAADLYHRYFSATKFVYRSWEVVSIAQSQWKKEEADLRRRVSKLPR
jgi:hypothetical protein